MVTAPHRCVRKCKIPMETWQSVKVHVSRSVNIFLFIIQTKRFPVMLFSTFSQFSTLWILMKLVLSILRDYKNSLSQFISVVLLTIAYYFTSSLNQNKDFLLFYFLHSAICSVLAVLIEIISSIFKTTRFCDITINWTDVQLHYGNIWCTCTFVSKE